MKNENIMFTRTIAQRSKARLIRSALVLGIVALIMQVSVPRAQAFDLSSLNGNYADSYQVLGPANSNQTLPPITTYSPYLTVVLWTFDGAGGFTASLVFNIGGGVILNPEFNQNCHRDLYCKREWYRHHELDGRWPAASPSFRDRRWRKAA